MVVMIRDEKKEALAPLTMRTKLEEESERCLFMEGVDDDEKDDDCEEGNKKCI